MKALNLSFVAVALCLMAGSDASAFGGHVSVRGGGFHHGFHHGVNVQARGVNVNVGGGNVSVRRGLFGALVIRVR